MRKFGLIGFPLGHSFSKKYFSEKFATEGIHDCVYDNYELPSIGSLPEILKDPELKGLNVTIPYKQEVLAYLDLPDQVVTEVGACNCIRIRNGKKEGFNTDVAGFEVSLKEKWQPSDKEALVLGTGGSSLAAVFVLRRMGVAVRRVSRTPGTRLLTYGDLTPELMGSVNLIVNCTPTGTFPDVAAAPPIPYHLLRADQYLFDLVYNPPVTRFLAEGATRGTRTKNGADMLKIQAEENWRLWNEF